MLTSESSATDLAKNGKRNLAMACSAKLIRPVAVTDNTGLLGPSIPANIAPNYSVHAIGFQSTFIVPAKSLSLFLKFANEYRALARPEGRTIVFGGSYTIRVPKR